VSPAHTRDPEELPRAILHVHRQHMGAAGPSRGGDGRLALRPGAVAVVFGNGAVHHVGAPGTAAGGSKGAPRGLRTTVPGPKDGGTGLEAARPPMARLSHGFRTMHLVPTNGRVAAAMLASSRHNIIPFMLGQRQAGVYPAEFAVDSSTLDDPDPKGLIDAIMSLVWPLEDSRCRERLEDLLPREMPIGDCGRPEDVADLVGRLGKGADPPVRLDTAFVSPALFARLDPGDSRMDYENVLRCGETSIISSGEVPEGTVYVTSSHHGPVFINGPTVIRREEGALAVARYCAAYEPAGGTSAQSPGFAVAAGS